MRMDAEQISNEPQNREEYPQAERFIFFAIRRLIRSDFHSQQQTIFGVDAISNSLGPLCFFKPRWGDPFIAKAFIAKSLFVFRRPCSFGPGFGLDTIKNFAPKK